jgi:hypothetical protein
MNKTSVLEKGVRACVCVWGGEGVLALEIIHNIENSPSYKHYTINVSTVT